MSNSAKAGAGGSLPTLHDVVLAAEQRGLLTIDQESGRITYHAHQDKDYSLLDPEEPVRALLFALICGERNYDPNRVKLEVPVKLGTSTKFADIVVYRDTACKAPFLVVEAIHPKPTRREKDEKVKQAFSYAKQLDAPYVMYGASADETDLWAVRTQWGLGERKRNRLGDAWALLPDYAPLVAFTLKRGGSNDLRPVAPSELEVAVRAAHAIIWSGGKRDPLEAFDEWSKLLFAKIYDETWTEDGQPYRFQVGINEADSDVAQRVRALFNEAKLRDTSVFTDELPEAAAAIPILSTGDSRRHYRPLESTANSAS